jgi:hypothetical protein
VKELKQIDLKDALETYGEPYSGLLGIKLESLDNDELFKWFLASLLFGAPIAETAAMETYHRFKDHNVMSPKRILETKWEGLVKIHARFRLFLKLDSITSIFPKP